MKLVSIVYANMYTYIDKYSIFKYYEPVFSENAMPNERLNYEAECSRLPTKTKLYFDGSCYVGSNTKTQFPYAIQLCNDIPSAAISRLAWIESEELIEKLRDVLVIHDRFGKVVGRY